MRLSCLISLLSCLVSLLFSTPECQAKVLWEISGEAPMTASPLITDTGIYLVNHRQLIALSHKGQELWRVSLPATGHSQAVRAGDKLLVHSDDGLRALNLQGQILWHHASEDGPYLVWGDSRGWGMGDFPDPWAFYRSAPTVSDQRVFYSTLNGTYGVNLESGIELWRQTTGATHTKAAVSGETLIVGSWDNTLYGLNQTTGEINWRFTNPPMQGEYANWTGWRGFNLDPVARDNAVYVGGRGTYFFKINSQTGAPIWSTKHASSWIGSAALVEGNHVYYGLSDGLALIGQDTDSGNIERLIKADYPIFAQPLSDGQYLYFATLAGSVFRHSNADGSTVKLYQTDAGRRNLHTYTTTSGKPQYPALDTTVPAHQAATQQVQTLLRELDSILSLAAHGGQLYLGTANGRLIALKL
ncbi:outer membrane protein assembly factor BamB family protein [Gilvimarinus algae]|uniref:PQQ-binding-like beta-propeller repeat protein n=1 Tax=Gilvimarinus algae TaxID=3058037 RepID=A0ABT8TD64_9GAMM|nr:PQQ-binding-like beta-propeller repeat protein [Gilvimarinus sp. SDUM040014]MDO3382049.1 PQQ-binding-like beta-propeller repeat protein [Gilvimarinus sp. SDUM040014]